MENSDFRSMMEQYNQELMRMQQRAEPPPPPADPVQSVTPTARQNSFTAPLKVRVTSANGAVPIPDALVIVTREENGETIVEAPRITDSSGLTEPILLPAVDPALTLQPGNDIPRIVYEVTVAAPDHYRARLSDLPLYGGIPTELPVSLIPLPEFDNSPEQEIQYTTPPINL